MVAGKPGFYLEGYKFGVYLMIPIVASYYYSRPDIVKKNVEYYKYVEYPSNPNTNLKQQVEDLIEETEKKKKATEAYQEVLRSLNQAAQKQEQYVTNNDTTSATTTTNNGGSGLWRWTKANILRIKQHPSSVLPRQQQDEKTNE